MLPAGLGLTRRSYHPRRAGHLRHRVIDLHCHPLPGIDDGPRSTEASLALLRCAYEAGTRTTVATPHVSAAYLGHTGASVRGTSLG